MRKKVRARFEVTWYDIVKCKTPLSLSNMCPTTLHYTTLLYTLHYTTIPYRRQPLTCSPANRKLQTANAANHKRYSSFWLVFHSACTDFFKTCHIHRLKHGKNDECKRKAFVTLSDVDRAFCVETYISSKSFDETRQLLDRKLGWDHRKTCLAPNNATINRWVSEFWGDRLLHRKQGSGWPHSVRSEEARSSAGGAAVRPG